MIETAYLDEIQQMVVRANPNEETVTLLRNKWPDFHFTYCQDDDISAASPVRETEKFNLYLVKSGEGCITFTTSPEHATGLVVAEIENWEEIQ